MRMPPGSEYLSAAYRRFLTASPDLKEFLESEPQAWKYGGEHPVARTYQMLREAQERAWQDVKKEAMAPMP